MNKNTLLQPCWVWNHTVERFVRDKVKGYSINICAGKSSIGDVKIDLDPQNTSVIKGDMKSLPYEDKTFDTVIQDPPWKIGYYDRWKPFFECVRICKVGGRIIYNAYWLPQSDDVKLEECFIRVDEPFTNASVLAIFKKIKHRKKYTLPNLFEIKK